jgi:divalent metal cation (Fe/Co/Zn/Cd) transporter
MTDMQKRLWASRARQLAWATLAYNLLEAAACAYFGVKDESLSLLGFGTDSLIEAASGAVVLWRFTRESVGGSEHPAERRAQRIIGGLLLALSASLVLGAAYSLWQGKGAESGMAGTVISLVSLAIMWALLKAKLKTAEALDSAVLYADAFCTKSCMWLSAALLGGSLLIAATHLIWFDALASLIMAYLVWKEGVENWKGEDCGCGGHS